MRNLKDSFKIFQESTSDFFFLLFYGIGAFFRAYFRPML